MSRAAAGLWAFTGSLPSCSWTQRISSRTPRCIPHSAGDSTRALVDPRRKRVSGGRRPPGLASDPMRRPLVLAFLAATTAHAQNGPESPELATLRGYEEELFAPPAPQI